MDRVEKLNDLYKGRILLMFINNQFHLAIDDRKDCFEPPKFSQPLNEAVEFSRVKADIKVITDVVDSLRLDK